MERVPNRDASRLGARIGMSDVTRILNAIERGDAGATDELLPLVYEELRSLAAQKLSHEPPGQTLQATALCMRRTSGWSDWRTRLGGARAISSSRRQKP